jgi:type 1 glutamine amidotransferase
MFTTRWVLGAICCFSMALHAADPRKILFVSGPKDHGAPGRHEYPKDLALLKYCLDNSGNKNLTTQIHVGKFDDLTLLNGADLIVIESSGDRLPSEYHPIFPPDANTKDHKDYDETAAARVKHYDNLMKKGVSLALFHYSIHIRNENSRAHMLDWLGGFYETGFSKTVVGNWSVAPTDAKHPILDGIQPWQYREEFYVNNRLPDDPRRTNLLTAKPQDGTGEASVVSWATQRKDGGRGFVMSGVDWHNNMLNEGHRRILLNGILWAAKLDIPKGGAQCTIPPEMLK